MKLPLTTALITLCAQIGLSHALYGPKDDVQLLNPQTFDAAVLETDVSEEKQRKKERGGEHAY